MRTPILNEDLQLADIPPAESDWDAIQRFALTFDGYKANGSFEACAVIANERRHESLNDLRTCLFFEQRRYRHVGSEPDAQTMVYIHELLERIRSFVQARLATEVVSAGEPAQLVLTRVSYDDLNPRQQENYNFAKISAILADYGYMTMRLSDDWQGADFIAQHVNGGFFLKVQLKGRMTFGKKYMGKDLYVAFPTGGEWYLYPHDELLERVLAETTIAETVSWSERGGYSFPSVSQQLRKLLAPFRIAP